VEEEKEKKEEEPYLIAAKRDLILLLKSIPLTLLATAVAFGVLYGILIVFPA